MVDTVAAIAAVLLLTGVTMATRIGGVWIMSYVEITPRIEAFLKYMAVSVLISIVVPTTIAAAPRIWIAVAAAGIVAAVTRNALSAMLVGAVLAAAVEEFGGVRGWRNRTRRNSPPTPVGLRRGSLRLLRCDRVESGLPSRSSRSERRMVGATGIEPVTPTMSR